MLLHAICPQGPGSERVSALPRLLSSGGPGWTFSEPAYNTRSHPQAFAAGRQLHGGPGRGPRGAGSELRPHHHLHVLLLRDQHPQVLGVCQKTALHRRQPAPALRPDGSQRSKARLPTCDTLRCEGPKPLPHNPPQVTPFLPALGLEAASASGQPGLVLSAEAPGLLSSTWGGLCPAPVDPAAGPAPARPSPVLIGRLCATP